MHIENMKINCFTIAIMLFILQITPILSQNVNESFHQTRLCADIEVEVTLASQMRADCISSTHAIEIDFAYKWKEATGQALAYAVASNLRPGIVLICERSIASCTASSLGVQQTLSTLGIEATLWECLPTDDQLDQCRKIEFGVTQ